MNSRHFVQLDGHAHAVDLVPLVAGAPIWEWKHCYEVASAVSTAAHDLGVELVWGGVWDRSMSAYGRSTKEIEEACTNYVRRRKAAGKRAAIDGLHFELAK